MNEQSNLKATGKAVLNDIVTLAKDTGTFIYELTMQLVNSVKTVVKSNADKKAEKKQKPEISSATQKTT